MINISEIEKKILSFWKEKDIFKKSLEKDSPQGDYVFYDGPPFATGTPHYGHIVASLMKDIVPRYWTMKGYRVERKWGWDCHGLPIENMVEEELELQSKKDIEKIGIDKFNESCRSKVLVYAEEWRKVVERIGRWVDMEQDYKTMDKDYMESVWWVFKELWNRDLIYEGYKSMHICPRCETTLSQSEVGQGYKDVSDLSGIFKFKLEVSQKIGDFEVSENTFVLAWTTTSWTLIGNVALAVGEDIKYSLVEDKKSKEKYILAKDLLEITLGDKYTGSFTVVQDDIFGRKLEGLKYEPLFDYYLDKETENKKNLYTIQTADFVDVGEGTGVVHIAPAFGEDDMNLGKEKNLPFIQHVKMDGRFTDQVKDFAGLEVKPKNDPLATDKKVIEYLEKKDLVFNKQEYVHSYPYCWRCDSPLLNYATSSWFVKIEKIKDSATETARAINWVPSHLKEGRFGKWLEGARDWSISRQRFWGSVMPIWKCQGKIKNQNSVLSEAEGSKIKMTNQNSKLSKECSSTIVIGSVKELERLSGEKIDDLHKHFVDKITFKCEKCGGVMKRIPDVLDCWFDSGSMPYAQAHYPFENKEKFEKNFPAEFIAEGVDQTRCWFYYLHILSTILKNSHCFQNVIANGIVLAEDGNKMSKHLQNYPDPMNIMDKYGADAVRYYLATSQVMRADDLRFSERGVDEVYKKVILILMNVLSFYKIFADLPRRSDADKTNDHVLDKWILAKVEQLKNEVTKAYDSYNLIKAARPLEEFINDLSTWYLRRSRERIKKRGTEQEHALGTLRYVLLELSKIMAPVMPFTAEYIYQELNGTTRPDFRRDQCGKLESVHLEDWPKAKEELINQKVLDYMQITRKIVEMALSKRAEFGIKVRQPLAKLKIKNQKSKMDGEYIDLIKDELNVKEVICETGVGDLTVELDTEITDELKEEGMFRELVRKINDLRKKMGLSRNDRVVIEYNSRDEFILSVIEKYRHDLIKHTVADEMVEVDSELEKVKVNEVEIGIRIVKC